MIDHCNRPNVLYVDRENGRHPANKLLDLEKQVIVGVSLVYSDAGRGGRAGIHSLMGGDASY